MREADSQSVNGALEDSSKIVSPSVWHGAVKLCYDYTPAKTRLVSAWHQAPLKVQRAFYPEAEGICHTVLIHTAGGMAGGDCLTYKISLGPQARAVLTTAAASKIYRMPAQGAEQKIEIDLAEGACLEWLPQETIVFNQARYRQSLKVNLAPGAGWLGWDIYRFGRTASGEQFLEGQWRSHAEVWQSGVPLWIDRQWLPGGRPCLDHPHGLDGYPVVGTLAWVGQPVEPDFVKTLRSRWVDSGNTLGEVGVTRLQQGVVCRYRGPSTQDVRHWFTQVWHDVRSYALGQSACLPRVWQL
jgi:urease accessory protein